MAKPIKRRLSRDEWKQVAKNMAEERDKLTVFAKRAFDDMRKIHGLCTGVTVVEHDDVMNVLKACIQIAGPYGYDEEKNEAAECVKKQEASDAGRSQESGE